jgi:hypothetical protein
MAPPRSWSGGLMPLVLVHSEGTYVGVLPSRRSQAVRPYNHATRGRVSGLSPKSRKNLMRKCGCAKTTQTEKAKFVSLTYHANWPADPVIWKQQLKAFEKRLRRRWPRAAFFWRLEPQERGAPHFHLIVYNVPYLPYQRVAEWWAEIIGASDDEWQIKAGTEVRRVKSQGQAVGYVAKYCAKSEEHEFREWDFGPVISFTGRLWGVVGARFIPWSKLEVWRVPSITQADGSFRYRLLALAGIEYEVPWSQRWGLHLPPLKRKRLDMSRYGWLISEVDGDGQKRAAVGADDLAALLGSLSGAAPIPPLAVQLSIYPE